MEARSELPSIDEQHVGVPMHPSASQHRPLRSRLCHSTPPEFQQADQELRTLIATIRYLIQYFPEHPVEDLLAEADRRARILEQTLPKD